MSIKVCDLAKELGVTAEEILDQLCKLYVDAEDEKSKIDDKVAGLIRVKLGVAEPVAEKPKKKPAKKKAVKKETKKKTTTTKAKKKKTDKDEEAKPAKKTKTPVKNKKTKKEEKAEETKTEKKEIKEKKEEKPKVKEEKDKGGIRIIKHAENIKPMSVSMGKDISENETVIEIIGDTSKPKVKLKKHEKAAQKAKKGEKIQEEIVDVPEPEQTKKTPQKIQLQVPINIRTLAVNINIKPNLVIQFLMQKGVHVNINQDLEEDVVREILGNFGYELELHETVESLEKELIADAHDIEDEENVEEEKAGMVTRAPVVTFMGHVDHGKTSLLDYIRKTMVTKGEKGGITQHIGAYKVETANGSVAFLDTPGHAAFTAMRARGAHATDVVVLVVAADDGIMPQTKEAIDHARAANVPIIVAINKCDLASAAPDKVKQELQKEDLVAEEWGGKTVMVEVSAITGEGVDNLVEMLMLESEMLELKANPELRARGVIIESKKNPGQGVVATFLVKNGTLHEGDVVICGSNYGKVKAMINDVSERVKEALPATPVEVLGLQGLPEAGEEFYVVKDEKKAKTLTTLKETERRTKRIGSNKRISLEDFHSQVTDGSMKELKIILKSDVQGSIEAINHSLKELQTDEVQLNLIHSAVGNINESDVMLAVVSNAVIIGFHVKVDSKAGEIAKSEKVDIHTYDIIYEAIADVKAAMEGLLEPEEKEIFHGMAKVLEIFSASKIGKVAGCSVEKGTIYRKDKVRIKRGQEIVFEGDISALKRFKDDVKEVKEGFECGISVKNFTDIRKNDTIESYIIEKIARRLEK